MTDDELRTALRRLREDVNYPTDRTLLELRAEMLRNRFATYSGGDADHNRASARIDQVWSSQGRLVTLVEELLLRVGRLDQQAVRQSPEPRPPEDGQTIPVDRTNPAHPVGFT